MEAKGQPDLSTAGVGEALQASLPLFLCIVGFGTGAYIGLSLEIEAIVRLQEHPLIGAALPVACLTVATLGIWRLRRFKLWLRPLALGALFGAATTGPIFVLGLQALANF